jgi:hypothetical protein
MEKWRHTAEKVSRSEAEEIKESQQLEPLVEADETDIWGSGIVELDAQLKNAKLINAPSDVVEVLKHRRDREIDAARKRITEMVNSKQFHKLRGLTAEILLSEELSSKLQEHIPNFAEASEAYRESNLSLMLSALLGKPARTSEIAARRAHAALRFWAEVRIPEDLWVSVAAHHGNLFLESARKFKESVGSDLARKMYSDFDRAARVRLLPVSRDRVAATFQKTKLVLADVFHPRMERIGGFWDWTQNKLALSSGLTRQENLEEVATHEYIHALAGTTNVSFVPEWALVIGEDEEVDDLGLTDAVRLRQGLLFTTGTLDQRSDTRFRWMNEAATELMVDEMIPNHPYKAYGEYRKAMAYLMESGRQPVPLELFKNAYFEEYEPSSREKIPHWKALRRSINAAHGSKFLIGFDKAITRDGVEKAIEMAKAGTFDS